MLYANAGLRGGDLVAVHGIGGLGHLGIQFARYMGFRTVAIGRGREKEKLAKELGAHVYIEPSMMLQRHYSVWAEPELFSQQLPAAALWGRSCPVLQPVGSSSWWVYLRTRCN
jgi:D-arabinose 1-dehydrogenase-like Zn-dependent alcohol dehydrogenase